MAAVKGMMRQVEEKYAMNEIEIIVWSNKIDLLALSNAKGNSQTVQIQSFRIRRYKFICVSFAGEVALHRLNWQRVWLLSPPLEDAKVTALAWRPDGRILVAAYTNSTKYSL